MWERMLKRKFVLSVQKLKTQNAVLILVYCIMISFNTQCFCGWKQSMGYVTWEEVNHMKSTGLETRMSGFECSYTFYNVHWNLVGYYVFLGSSILNKGEKRAYNIKRLITKLNIWHGLSSTTWSSSTIRYLYRNYP